MQEVLRGAIREALLIQSNLRPGGNPSIYVQSQTDRLAYVHGNLDLKRLTEDVDAFMSEIAQACGTEAPEAFLEH